MNDIETIVLVTSNSIAHQTQPLQALEGLERFQISKCFHLQRGREVEREREKATIEREGCVCVCMCVRTRCGVIMMRSMAKGGIGAYLCEVQCECRRVLDTRKADRDDKWPQKQNGWSMRGGRRVDSASEYGHAQPRHSKSSDINGQVKR